MTEDEAPFWAPETVLEVAHSLVYGDRAATYGDPRTSGRRIAAIWSGILVDKLRPGMVITREEAMLMLLGMKISREVGKPKKDNRVDLAGYAEVLDKMYRLDEEEGVLHPLKGSWNLTIKDVKIDDTAWEVLSGTNPRDARRPQEVGGEELSGVRSSRASTRNDRGTRRTKPRLPQKKARNSRVRRPKQVRQRSDGRSR